MPRIQSALIYPRCYVSDWACAAFNSLSASTHFRYCKNVVKARGMPNASEPHTQHCRQGNGNSAPEIDGLVKPGYATPEEPPFPLLSDCGAKPVWKIWWFVFSPSCTTFLSQHFTVCVNRKPCLELTFQRRPWSIKAKFRTRSFFLFFLTSAEPLWTFGQKQTTKKVFCQKFRNVNQFQRWREHCWSSPSPLTFSGK